MDFILNGSFQDFDMFAHAMGNWDLDFVQLDNGMPFFEVSVAALNNIQMSHTKFSQKLCQQGAAPAGKRTIGIPLNGDIDLHWYGHTATESCFMVFPDDGELFSLSNPQFDVVTYSLPIEKLNRLCEELELPTFEKLIGRRSVFKVPDSVMSHIRSRALELIMPLKNGNEAFYSNPIYRDEYENGFARTILKAIALSTHYIPPLQKNPSKRAVQMKKIISYLDATQVCPSISDLCQVLGLSERSLQYVVRGELDMTPKQLLKSWRLHHLRRALLREGNECHIKKIMSKHGFIHNGQNCSDYRMKFGELPRETFQRGMKIK